MCHLLGGLKKKHVSVIIYVIICISYSYEKKGRMHYFVLDGNSQKQKKKIKRDSPLKNKRVLNFNSCHGNNISAVN